MKWKLFLVFCLSISLQSKALSTTIRPLTFEKVVSRADLIATGFIYEAESAVRDSSERNSQEPLKYCARIERAVSGSLGSDSVCFLALAGLKVGVPYLLFLSKSEDVDSEGNPINYVGSLALEVAGPNPHHDSRVVRWEAIRHPIIPGLIEDKAVVDYQDASDVTNKRSIVVYSYFPLKDVEKVVRQLKASSR
ncbi:hypothetical protein [Microbulbifer halophilus]|uniref:Uncharacterized protein n=1 Tax=Microbulbifer halophilus TaxID=453963 RepID=A0ABW5EDG2_9GAMM|nr:hypothetical protein [Microbulbifer halophilus]MCW8126233.1 hypothetical protein [Microbulbifer halophilus]